LGVKLVFYLLGLFVGFCGCTNMHVLTRTFETSLYKVGFNNNGSIRLSC
jgi:hypothetical protein